MIYDYESFDGIIIIYIVHYHFVLNAHLEIIKSYKQSYTHIHFVFQNAENYCVPQPKCQCR